MATTVARLEAILEANTKHFEHGMDKAETKMHKVGKGAAIAGAAIAGGIAVGLEKSVEAAMEAQKSQARLEIAFKTAHLSAAKYEPQIAKLEASSRKLGFTEEDVHTAMGSLIVATGSVKESTRELGIAQDLARFKGVSLEQGTKALTMAHAGSTRALKQLGIEVVKVTAAQDAVKNAYKHHTGAAYENALAAAKVADKQATVRNVMQTVTDKVHGQADAYSKTAAGSMEAFKAQLNFLEISLGTALLPAITKVTEAASKMTEWLTAHPKLAKILIISLGGLAAALLAASVAQRILNIAVATNPYVAAIIALVAIGVAVYVFRDKIMNVFNWIKDHWPLLTAILAGPIGLAVLEIVRHRDRIVDIFTNLPGQIGGAFTAGAKLIKKAVEDLFGKVIGWVEEALGIKSPSTVFHKIGQQAIQGFINGVGSMAGKLKSAVVGFVEDKIKSIPHAIGGIIHGGKATGSQQNRNIGQQMAARYGWSSGPEWIALDALANQESGWNQYAKNKSSGAYGIAQALPPTKYPKAAQESGGSDPAAQIGWMLNYIKGRYGDPMTAWGGYWQRGGWYDKGGVVPGTGPQLAVVHGGETILPTHKPISHHIDRIADSAVDWKQALTRFVLRTTSGDVGIPTERLQRAFFRSYWGHGISRAVMNAVVPWWEREGYFEQLASRRGMKSFDNGGWLPPGLTMAYNGTGQPERVGGGDVIIPVSIGGEHVATVIFDQLRRKAKVFENRNGRPAFGGA